MDIRKQTLSTLKTCRFCLSQTDQLTNIYEKYRAPKNSVTLPLKILSCLSIEVLPSDKMPIYICNRCKFFMDVSYEFKHMCRQADEHILQYVHNATTLPPMTWSQSLLKLYRLAHKTSEIALMKTVVEGGATVQVTAQESDSDEEDDENVYNVKIADGSDEGSKSTRVKVITADKDKGKPKRGKGQSDNTAELVREKTMLRDGCWPCDQCRCTYPLQQLLKLHKLQKHRERNVPCTECDAKFFTIYDMMMHQQTHSNEMKFQCVVCDKKFKRLILLKRHEKSMHADLPQQPCSQCPATFLTIEELEAHQTKHNRIREKRFTCEACNKRFHEKSTLQRHIENVHNENPPFSCQYCPSRFSSVSKLSRHVRTHAGDRSYPCKYCNKSFIKSHHYTRHLRLKHRETIRTCRGPFGESDQYRCEQCEDSFATQDELIYHSAIHATQNLICPLCQEKFDDVDTVTAHIKSHVNGTEFMCDLCELVFTSQEKLDVHLTVAHDDELRNPTDDLGQDESSMEMDVDDEECYAGFDVKEEDDHMVVEIKKPAEFMLSNSQAEIDEKIDNTNSEESEPEMTFTELATVDTLTIPRKEELKPSPEKVAPVLGGATLTKTVTTPTKVAEKVDSQTATILRKAEEIKKKVIQLPPEPIADKKVEKTSKSENSNTAGASDKSLRLLEKDLQELKRTNTRSEAVKTPAKPVEFVRNRRAQIHTSTPKLRTAATAAVVEEKKVPAAVKSPAVEKKQPERRVVTKENKEPKESKETRTNNVSAKEEKEVKEKEVKETPKTVVKNGNSDIKNTSEDGIRRSTRPSKIKDYAKMIRDRAQDSDENDDSDDSEDEEYKEVDRSTETKKGRRASIKPVAAKPTPPVAPTVAPTPRKRGRPRKEVKAPKVRKEEKEEVADDDDDAPEIVENEKETKAKSAPAPTPAPTLEKETEKKSTETADGNKSTESKSPAGVLVSPTGQTLKKIPIKALPPGVKPLPLPVNARPMGGEVCEMQIGKKVVKVQKIVMTKAEVEAMAKKGLVEMKDGTMVLKQGIKIPTADPTTLKTSQDAGKESPSKKAAPTRCDFGDA